METPNILSFEQLAVAVIQLEAQAVSSLATRIGEDFTRACQYLLDCQGRVVVTGMGKSGHIAGKLAATLASTGTPAFFVHPGEASHGDMGMITEQDVLIAISYSGKTHEIASLLPFIKRLNIPLIAFTGNSDSPLAQAATVHLDISVEKEACPFGLTPTASTTTSLVMGDALAVALLTTRGFTIEDFARSHPGGNLGRRLLLRVQDIMRTGTAVPIVSEQATLSEALLEITQKGLGMTTLVNAEQQLMGVYTDGDLRRTLSKDVDIHQVKMADVATYNCKTISPSVLAVEAVNLMEKYKITALVVTDDKRIVVGVLHMHDLLSAGVL